MLKIGAACGSGLGSSFMVEMNIQTILKRLGYADEVKVDHFDLGSASNDAADVWVIAKDLEDSAKHLNDVRVLNSIIDMDELEVVIKQILEDKNIT